MPPLLFFVVISLSLLIVLGLIICYLAAILLGISQWCYYRIRLIFKRCYEQRFNPR